MRTGFNTQSRQAKDFWPADLSSHNAAWPVRLTKGMVTEIICEGNNSGSAGLIHALIHRGAEERQIIGMVDGADSLDVVSMAPRDLSRLLWVRCRCAAEALRSADLILRDNNFSVVLVDLKLNPESELRKIPAQTWYRLQRLVENSSTVCVIFTPRLLVNATRQRFSLPGMGNTFFKS
jgi:hypothetical protein